MRANSYLIGNCTFTVLVGSLPEISADALVSSDDNYLTMGGGVSLALLRAGGRQIEKDAHKHIPLSLGDVVVTTAGGLRAKYIFHGVTIDMDDWTYPDGDCLTQIVTRCLSIAEVLRLRHVAFPALGAGSGGFPYELAADAMTRAIAAFLSRAPKSVAEVSLVLYAPGDPQAQQINTFYERAAGIAAQWTDGRRLRELIDEMEALLSRTGSPALRERVQRLRQDVALAEESLADAPDAARQDAIEVANPLAPASRRAGEIAGLSAEVVDWEDLKARATVLQLRLQSLRTQHNILIGNRNRLEERKAMYGPHAVPLDVENALIEIVSEIGVKEDEVRAVKSELVGLGRG